MGRRIFVIGFSILTLAACGDSWSSRGLSGGGLGAGTALLMAGNPLLGAALGAGVGVASTRDHVDLGDAPGYLENLGYFGGY